MRGWGVFGQWVVTDLFYRVSAVSFFSPLRSAWYPIVVEGWVCRLVLILRERENESGCDGWARSRRSLCEIYVEELEM